MEKNKASYVIDLRAFIFTNVQVRQNTTCIAKLLEISRTIKMLNRFRSTWPIWGKQQLSNAVVYSCLVRISPILVWSASARGNSEQIQVLLNGGYRFIENLLLHRKPRKPGRLMIEHIYLHWLALQVYGDLKFVGALFLSAYKCPECKFTFRKGPYIKKVCELLMNHSQYNPVHLIVWIKKCPKIPVMAYYAKTTIVFKQWVKTLLLSI